jgi:prepilin-type N-terminal cleavage/methylation domain-containing protein
MTRNAGARRPGFTLVELMVAMALMMILTGSVVFIFTQAQKIFSKVDASVQVYQYARYAFDQMERDLANVIPSSDMEFYDDQPPPGGRVGRYDPGEELPLGGREGNALYHHSFTLRQPAPYTGADGLQHRYDSIYFKTVTVSSGKTSAALVEYALDDVDKERPKLIKRTWRVTGLDPSSPTRPKLQVNGAAGKSAKPVEQDLCLYTVDVRFEAFVRNRRQDQVGHFHECETLVDKLPRMSPGGALPFEKLRNDLAPPDYSLQTYYDVRHDRDALQPDLGVFDPAENYLFRTQKNFSFPMLREGDRIYCWGGALAVPKEYTIDSFRKPDGTPWTAADPPEQLRIKFKEAPPEPPSGAPAGAPLECEWDTSWLPPAVRVTLRIKDAKSLQTRSVQRVFKILAN